MKRYDFPTPRLAFGAAAVALTALTLGVSLVAPANLGTARDAVPVTAAADEPYRTVVIVTPTRVDVIAVRTSTTASAPARDGRPNRRQHV